MAQTLTENQAELLRHLIRGWGLEVVGRVLRLNTTTLLRAAVGLALHTGTHALIQQALAMPFAEFKEKADAAEKADRQTD